jgi:hypothetical protein
MIVEKNESNYSKMTKLYHLTCVTLYLIFFIYDRIVSSFSFFSNLLFLTFITFHLNWIYFILSILIGFKFCSQWNKDTLDKYFNLCFNLGFTTGVMFWAMYLQDPLSILPKGVTIPIILNVFIHGGIFVLAFFEQTIFNRRKNNNHIQILFIIAFIATYTTLLKICYIICDYAVYPFVKENLIGFFTIVISATVICLVGHLIYKILSFTEHKILLEEELKEKVEETPSV